MENSMEVPPETKNRVAIWSSNPTPGHISRQNCNSKRYTHHNVHRSTMYNSQDMEATYMSINRWVDKEVVYIHNGILFSHKKERMPFAATWMDLEIIILSEVSQKEKDEYHMISFICEIWSMTQMNLSKEQKQTHRYIEETYGCQGEWGWGRDGFGIWD